MLYNFKEDGILKKNHNSIDLTELEMLDDNNEEPRQPHDDIVQVILLLCILNV